MRSRPGRSLLATWLAAIAAGCATPARHQVTLDAWVGHDVNELVASLGPPTSSHTTPSGQTLLTWSMERWSSPPVPPKAFNHVRPSYSTAYQRPPRRLWCETTFTLDASGRVLRGQGRGNHCVSRCKEGASADSLPVHRVSRGAETQRRVLDPRWGPGSSPPDTTVRGLPELS